MKKNLSKIITCVVIILILVLCYLWGGNAPSPNEWNTNNTEQSKEILQQNTATPTEKPKEAEPTDKLKPTERAEPTDKIEQTQEIKKPEVVATKENKPVNSNNTPMTAQEKTELASKITDISSYKPKESISYSENAEIKDKDEYHTEPVPEGKPIPVEPQNETITDERHTCTLSIRCDTILKNIAWLDQEKIELVPKDGVVFATAQVDFYEGESVFNLLKREMKKNKIHMEFVKTPIYNSAYIEGIANLYELDCGELSGWVYKVNDWFPNYGCSRYKLKPNDRVEFVYTCDLGTDVGGYFNLRGVQRDE